MVRKDERGEGKFDTQTKALELATYTVNITDNHKVFTPDHNDTTKKIVAYATDIYHRTRVANNIPFKTAEAGVERNRLQNIAIAECESLRSEIQIAKMLFHLRTKRVKYWEDMIVEVQDLLRKWRDSDADRSRKMKPLRR